MSGHRVLFVVSLAASLLMVGVGMIVALLPQRVLDHSGSLQAVGYVASAFALSYLLLQLPIGRLADRFGAKPFLALGYLLCCFAGLVFFHAGSAETIFLGRFVQGAGEAPVWALGPALLALAYPQAKGKAIGIYNAAIHAGLMIGPLLGILLFPSGIGNAPFLVFALLCCAGAVTIALFLPRGPASGRNSARRATRPREGLALLKAFGPAVALCGVFSYGAGYGIFVSVLPAFLTLWQGFDSRSTGVLFVLFYAAIGLAQLVAGPLSDRHGRHPYMIAGLASAAAGFAVFADLPQPWIYLPLSFASLGLGVFCVASIAYLNECVPDSLRATVSGAFYLAWGLGYFIGPIGVGSLGEWFDPRAGYLLLALLMAVQAGVLALSRLADSRRNRTAKRSAPPGGRPPGT